MEPKLLYNKFFTEIYFLWYYFYSSVFKLSNKFPSFLSGHIGLDLKPELEPEPKLWGKVEPEPKINNFGSATLYTVHFPLSCIFMQTVISVAGPADARRPM